jgi:hypothetical protein
MHTPNCHPQNGLFHRQPTGQLAKTVAAVKRDDRPGIAKQLRGGLRIEFSGANRLDIAGNKRHPM